MAERNSQRLKLFLAGDIMTGRAIDQLLPHPNEPRLYEPYITDARDYVRLAERRSGEMPSSVDFDYIWGDALALLAREKPDWRIANLETAVTDNDEPWPGKGIHYRMHPDNAPCLKALGLDACVLANNHLLDWHYHGLTETQNVLRELGIAYCGAGPDAAAAAAPAILEAAGGQRVLVFSVGLPSSGIPPAWAASPDRAGVGYLPDLSEPSQNALLAQIDRHRQSGDCILVSIHWGGNWGYGVDAEQRRFARALIDGGVHLVHGHSSHHPIGMECYRGHLICYGCGDFINDYEGIGGHEDYRPHLVVMYLPRLDRDGKLTLLQMYPLQINRFRLQAASETDADWLAQTLDRESRDHGLRVQLNCPCDDPDAVGSTWLEGVPNSLTVDSG